MKSLLVFCVLPQRLHSSVPLSSDTEQALEDENRSLKSQLEEARRAASRAGKEKEELSRRLEERDLEREVLKRGKSDLEEQKRLLDRALEKINKEVRVRLKRDGEWQEWRECGGHSYALLRLSIIHPSSPPPPTHPFPDGDDDGGLAPVVADAAEPAGRLPRALQKGPAGRPAQQQRQAG